MLASTAGSAAAQHNVLPDTGGRVYGLVGGGFGDGTFVATGAGAGLRLTPHLGLDLELTRLSGSGRTEEVVAADPFPGILVFSTTTPPSTTIRSSTVLGGGVDVLLWRGFGGGVDIRWLRVLRAYDALDTAQATARASYRF